MRLKQITCTCQTVNTETQLAEARQEVAVLKQRLVQCGSQQQQPAVSPQSPTVPRAVTSPSHSALTSSTIGVQKQSPQQVTCTLLSSSNKEVSNQNSDRSSAFTSFNRVGDAIRPSQTVASTAVTSYASTRADTRDTEQMLKSPERRPVGGGGSKPSSGAGTPGRSPKDRLKLHKHSSKSAAAAATGESKLTVTSLPVDACAQQQQAQNGLRARDCVLETSSEHSIVAPVAVKAKHSVTVSSSAAPSKLAAGTAASRLQAPTAVSRLPAPQASASPKRKSSDGLSQDDFKKKAKVSTGMNAKLMIFY